MIVSSRMEAVGWWMSLCTIIFQSRKLLLLLSHLRGLGCRNVACMAKEPTLPDVIQHNELDNKDEILGTCRESGNRATTMSRRGLLVGAIRRTVFNSPRKKEIDEAYAFANAARNYFGANAIDVVIDVAGGHGALAAVLLMGTSAKEAVVIDPAPCTSGVEGIAAGWGHNFKDKVLRYRREELECCLAQEIRDMQTKYGIEGDRVLVVACHACQFLTLDTLHIAQSEGVNVCVMPCCQKDTTGGSIKAFAKGLKIDIGIVIDILTAGSMMVKYAVKLKLIDASITPQNRMIMCRLKQERKEAYVKSHDAAARRRLKCAYSAAHGIDTQQVCDRHEGKEELVRSGQSGRDVDGHKQQCQHGDFDRNLPLSSPLQPTPSETTSWKCHLKWTLLSHGLSAAVGALAMYTFMSRISYLHGINVSFRKE